jgi:hypothetical protein
LSIEFDSLLDRADSEGLAAGPNLFDGRRFNAEIFVGPTLTEFFWKKFDPKNGQTG